MTTRAPPLASMAAVAAPRPDAEPVTIAHKPSFDIRISSRDWPVEAHHIVPQNACKSAKLRCAELMLTAAVPFMPPLQGHLRTSALVMAMAFPHHAVQEKTQAGAWVPSESVRIETRNAVAESENIVAET